MHKNMTEINHAVLAAGLALILCMLQPLSYLIAAAAPGTDISADTPDDADIITEEELEAAIHISNADELTVFAQNCTLDTWSVGKIFILDSDIDLSDTNFTVIPTFGGIFLGQGHTISGLSLTGGSNNMALFRYVQESGRIYQLSVSGAANAESTHSGAALFAGVNNGVIESCHVSGTVNGGEKVGCLVGINDATGIISNCSTDGMVTGDHLIGGIAGENLGSISGCQNHCSVNTIAEDNNISLTSIDIDAALTDLLTTENAASVTDIGGITGSNSGSLRACVNDGPIGYQHVGYNIGGIAGSQSGFIEGCVNYGILNGRKDIGGIAGQMEPSSLLKFDEDTLKKLNVEFDKLHDLLTQLDRDCGDSSSTLTGQVGQLLDSVEGAQNAVDNILSSASEDFSSFSEPTDLTLLPSPRPVSLDFLDALPTVSIPPAATPSASASPAATPAGTPVPTDSPTPEPNPTVTPGTESGTSDMAVPESSSETSDITVSEPAAALTTESYDIKPLYAPRQIRSGILYEPDEPTELDEDSVPVGTATPTPDPLLSWPEGWPTPSIEIDLDDYNFLDDIDREEVEKSINDAQEHIYEDASGLLSSIQNRIQERASLIGSRFDSAKNMLGSSFSSIITDTRLLNSMLDSENQLILDDFQAIIDELNVITDLITAPDPMDPDDILEDISDEDQITDTTGKVMNSINKGLINGDLNVGGIAGSLSRENNLDPENDFDLDQYDTTLNFRYQERIVVRQCENLGRVEGKKDCVGGIAGEMLLGSIMECTNSGSLKSEGSQVGGIAGLSSSTIRASSSKCALWGKDKVGGIAGEGKVIRSCFSMVEIREGDHYLGSVAGIIDSSGEVTDCFFVEGCPAGIDGISYAGSAQPLPYEEFLALPDLPDIFQNIYLTFEADGHIVETITLSYGESLHPDDFPSVPEKDGFTGKWNDFSSTEITFDQTIEAIYNEYITTLESDLKNGFLPVLLAEGIFTPEDTLSVSEVNAYPEDGLTNAVCYSIRLSGGSDEAHTFRFLIPQDMERPQLEWLNENKEWISLPSERDGSYLVFSLTAKDAVVCCVDRPATISPVMITLLVILLLLLIGILILFFFRKKKK